MRPVTGPAPKSATWGTVTTWAAGTGVQPGPSGRRTSRAALRTAAARSTFQGAKTAPRKVLPVAGRWRRSAEGGAAMASTWSRPFPAAAGWRKSGGPAFPNTAERRVPLRVGAERIFPSRSRVPLPVSGPVLPWPVRKAVAARLSGEPRSPESWRVPLVIETGPVKPGLAAFRWRVPPPVLVSGNSAGTSGAESSSRLSVPSTWMPAAAVRASGTGRMAWFSPLPGS